MDVTYLCTQIGNLSGVPVRWYEGETLRYFYAVATLPYDPFELCKEDVFEINEHVGYYITHFENYYGVVRFGDSRFVLGPTAQIPLSDQKMRDIAFQLGVKKEEVRDFIDGLKRIAPLPLSSVVQYLCLINHIVNNGEKQSLLRMAIRDRVQEDFAQTIEEEKAKRTVRGMDGDHDFPHNTMGVEEYMLELVRKGDIVGLKEFFENVPSIRGGVMASNDLRQMKNLLVVTATLVSRAAIRGGMEAEEALTLSDSYIQKCEPMMNVEELINLNYRLVMDYADRMRRRQCGGAQTKLVTEVNDYVRAHFSEYITVGKLARVLCRGRSRLSTDFKKETGEDLSVYILHKKIEEAKSFLRYTDKPIVDIALYLGFSSQSHFTRVFKKYTEQTPNEYRSTERPAGWK